MLHATKMKPLFRNEQAELYAFVGEDARALASPHLLYNERRLATSLRNLRDDEENITAEDGMKCIFTVAQSILGIKCVKVSDDCLEDDTGKWHPDVDVYRVSEETSGETRGYIFCDLYARPEKDAAAPAWVAKIQSRSRLFPDQIHDPSSSDLRLPAISLCANAPAHLAATRRLPLERVADVFHELGHALHYVLSEAEDAACGYEQFEWDAVEIPSYFMEHWAKDTDTLRGSFGEAACQKLASVHSAKHMRTASATMRQLQFALVDMALHADSNIPASDDELFSRVGNIMASTFHAYSPLALEDTRFPCFFTHIFTGEYAAGYYGYLWSAGMAAEAYDAVKKDKARGRDFRDKFLALGSGADPMRTFTNFLGREPTPDALLHSIHPCR